ncbi:MAG: 2-oxo-4-hydroxy-4-carboxy-5-ureidoimidazoline decarboxylase [Chloroflexi bacterium]|nr:MAG: 2-oxo-4-hydroxy-4-carboxy-5-ureidoimidazoline decarboxylase [Chloroflexota bacterium]
MLIDGIASFNALPSEAAEEWLYRCFANRTWATQVAARRPYKDVGEVVAAAESAWSGLTADDWLEAFAAHPRIGEKGGHAPATSEREQRKLAQGSGVTLNAIAAENREYERQFGHVFLIAASGRTAEEILGELRRRRGNDAATELQVAAAEQRKITRLRLEALLKG